MRLKKLFCPLLALTLVLIFTCMSASVSAKQIVSTGEDMVIARATGRFNIDVSPGNLRQANTSFSLDPGEVVTIKSSYFPFSSNVDVGLIAPDGRFYYVTVTDGILDQSIEITERGEYVFAVRNKSSYSINISGYVNC